MPPSHSSRIAIRTNPNKFLTIFNYSQKLPGGPAANQVFKKLIPKPLDKQQVICIIGAVQRTTLTPTTERTDMFNWNRDRKALARQSAMVKDAPGAAKVAVFLPSNRQLCVKAALEAGTINKKTFIIAIEKMPSVLPVLRRGMKRLGFIEGKNLYIHQGDAHTCNVEPILNGRKIDFAFLDFCGEAKAHTVAWVAHMMQFVKTGSDIHVTHSFKGRANKLLKQAASRDEWAALAETLKGNDNCSLPKDNKEEASIWLFWAGLSANHNVDIVAHQRYKDEASRTPMCLTSFRVRRGKWGDKAGAGVLLNWLEDFKLDPYTMMVPKKLGRPRKNSQLTNKKEKNPIMVSAGRKAWATRLRNQQLAA